MAESDRYYLQAEGTKMEIRDRHHGLVPGVPLTVEAFDNQYEAIGKCERMNAAYNKDPGFRVKTVDEITKPGGGRVRSFLAAARRALLRRARKPQPPQ